MKKQELPKGAKIGRDVAEKFINDWHDYRKVKEPSRINLDEDTGKDSTYEKLVESFMYGELEFNPENGVLKQNLQFPVKTEKGETKLTSLDWKPRIKERDLTEPMRGVKAKDTFGMMKAYISAATGVNKGLLGAMDNADYGLSQSINTYFL